ncbi:hypothetical protein FB451DRAFT_1179088 [Mycena latifolia]|nr:hypothetical protein FB451DRAFT_1179088 [Mycena latifolia]
MYSVHIQVVFYALSSARCLASHGIFWRSASNPSPVSCSAPGFRCLGRRLDRACAHLPAADAYAYSPPLLIIKFSEPSPTIYRTPFLFLAHLKLYKCMSYIDKYPFAVKSIRRWKYPYHFQSLNTRRAGSPFWIDAYDNAPRSLR